MIGQQKMPSKSEICRAIQRSGSNDLVVIEPVTPDTINDLVKEISKLLGKFGIASIVVVKQS